MRYNNQRAFECYCYFLAVKRHFTSSYDIVKYNGKTNANIASYEKRRDRFFFDKLSKNNEYKDLIVANVIANPNVWVGELVDGGLPEQRLIEYKKRKETFTYHYERDLKKLDGTLNYNLTVVDGQHPPLLQHYLGGSVNIDTMCALNMLTNYLKHWDAEIQDTILFPKASKMIKKYEAFISFDVQKLRKKTLDIFKQIH
jgi:hypothetical protein